MNDGPPHAIRTAVPTQHHIVVVVAVLLAGGLIGHVISARGSDAALFSAGYLGLLFGFTFALALFWYAGCQVARLLPEDDLLSLFIQAMIKPGLILITLALGYEVVSIALEPFLSPGGQAFYDYVFGVSTLAAGLWFVIAVGRFVQRCCGDRSVALPTETEVETPLARGFASSRHGKHVGKGWEVGSASQSLQPLRKSSVVAPEVEHHI